MALSFVCSNTACARGFKSTERFVRSSKGKCPTCLKREGIPKICAVCSKSFIWHEHFARIVGHPDHPQMCCPTCTDRLTKMANPQQPVVKERELLHLFPLARVQIDMRFAEICDPQGKANDGRVPARRLSIRDKHGVSYEGRLDIYDYRPDAERHAGSLARVRIMQARHEGVRKVEVKSGTPLGPKSETMLIFDDAHNAYVYLVLEPPARDDWGMEPAVTLCAPTYHQKSALKGGKSASGGVIEDRSYWSKMLTSCSRSGAHGGATIVAIVDDDHPLIIRQDNSRWRYGRTEATLEEAGFRESGLARLTLFVPGAESELVDRLSAEGFKSKLTEKGVFVRLKRVEDQQDVFLLPANLPRHELRVESCESGGGYTNTGHAQIVAGLRGQPLTPYATAGHRGDLVNGNHGWFSELEGLATVQACWWSKAAVPVTVELATHQVVVDGLTVRLVSEILYQGDPGELSVELDQCREAVTAAAAKCRDYHCRGLFFAAHQPIPAL